jgi:hypothetical protein
MGSVVQKTSKFEFALYLKNVYFIGKMCPTCFRPIGPSTEAYVLKRRLLSVHLFLA